MDQSSSGMGRGFGQNVLYGQAIEHIVAVKGVVASAE